MIDKIFKWSLYTFIFSIIFSLAGYGIMVLRPTIWQEVPLFGYYQAWLIKIPTWIYMATLPVMVFSLYLNHLGLYKSLFVFLWINFIGLMMELIGTKTGFPFGTYFYTDLLGAKIMDSVPYFIPLSWYAMALLSYEIVLQMRIPSALNRILYGSLLMVLWDISLDPAMSYAFGPFWEYPNGGFFYGMPAQNLLGWFFSSFIIMWGLDTLIHIKPSFSHWSPRIWFLNCFFPFCISLWSGYWAAFWVGLIATLIPLIALKARSEDF